jgi:hypothetical protein
VTDQPVLMTVHGTALFRAARGQSGDFVQGSFSTLDSDAEPLTTTAMAEAGLAISPAADERLVTVSRGATFLRADAGGRHTAFDRDVARAHETFLPVRAADRAIIGGLLRQDFLWRSSLRPTGSSRRLREPFSLELGHVALDLRQQLPFLGRATPFRISALIDGWRHDELCLYKPLVVFMLLGETASESALETALASLRGAGSYGGDVMIVTDRSRADILSACSVDPARIGILSLAAIDAIGRDAARYLLPEMAGMHRHQPILAADAQAVFRTPIEPMLRRLAGHDRIALHPRNGSPPNRSCVDGGTLGIANTIEHADTFRLIRRLILNEADLLGRSHAGRIDRAAHAAPWRLAELDTGFFGSKRDSRRSAEALGG